MTEQFHSGFAYPAFDESMRLAESWLQSQPVRCWDINPSALRQRLIQRIAELALLPYLSICATRVAANERPFAPAALDVNCGGLRIGGLRGNVQISMRVLLRSMGEFILHWFHVLGAIIRGCIAAAEPRKGRVTLVFGVAEGSIFNGDDDSRFLEFCRKGEIRPLQSCDRMIVQCSHARDSTSGNSVTYHRYPVHALIASTRLGALCRFRLLIHHLSALLAFISGVIRLPLLAILARDFAYRGAIRMLDKESLIGDVVQTNSAYTAQPLWMRAPEDRSFVTHMVFYSQNVAPPVYRNDMVKSSQPSYRHISVDEIWVWTDGFKSYLLNLGVTGRIHVVGPILWYLYKPGKRRRSGSVKIAVFDVTPVRDEVATDLGLLGNYYSTNHMIRFLDDVLSVGRELNETLQYPVELLLKHKRQPGGAHDNRYLDFVQGALANKQNNLVLVPAEANMYAMLEDCMAAIVIPYSSPAYVADHMGLPAVYYDPTEELMPVYEKKPLIDFVSGRTRLLAAAYKALGEANHAPSEIV